MNTQVTADKIYSITDLTKEFGVTTRTIRFYESEGMLRPKRNGRQRLFSPRQRTRLKLILRGKRLGFSLADIREIIDLYDGEPGEAGQLNHFIEKISQHSEELNKKRNDIEATLTDLARVESRCQARLNELDQSRLGQSKLGQAQ